MPIYEYKCENGHVFDVIQKISDDPLTVCGECGATVRKLLSPIAISFKGSGFYSTDYSGSSNGSQSTKTESKTESNGSSSTNGKSENKSAEKSSAGSKKD